MRNKLSYDLFSSFSKGNISPKLQYVIVKLLDKYLHLKKTNVLTVKNINAMIDQNIKTIYPYVKEDETKWPIDSVQFLKGSNFNYEIDIMKKWVKNRLPKVENYLLNLQ